ncbi:hypothetical protein [Methylorubrum zatmanii]
MTREEIDRHVAGILALRRRRSQRSGLAHGNDFNPRRRRIVEGVHAQNIDADVAPVDRIFTARQRYGWLPRGGDE